MSATIFMEKSYIIASIMKTKNKFYKKSYVTKEECNALTQIFMREYSNNNLSVCITDEIDSDYFKVTNDIIILNDGRTIADIEERFQAYISIDHLMILWNDKFILEKLGEIKTENSKKYFDSTPLDKIIDKIIENPKLFYENISNELTNEEFIYIHNSIEGKTCSNCSNINCKISDSLKPIDNCLAWSNKELVGKIKLLRK